LLVRTCFELAKCTKKGRRFKPEWVYECLLMRISAPKLYRRLCEENKMPLPTIRLLRRYLKSIAPVYGFDENLFAAMKKKAGTLQEPERHGAYDDNSCPLKL